MNGQYLQTVDALQDAKTLFSIPNKASAEGGPNGKQSEQHFFKSRHSSFLVSLIFKEVTKCSSLKSLFVFTIASH